MKKILEGILSKVGVDKYYHFVVGFFLYIILNLFLIDFIALSIVIVIAFITEVRDYYREDSKFDEIDFFATILPALLIFILT